MKTAWLGAVSGLLASAGLCLAQNLDPAPGSLDKDVPDSMVLAGGVKDQAATAAANAGPQDATAVLPPLVDWPHAGGDRLDSFSHGIADNCERFWFSADYLLWWVKKGPCVPLVTTGPAGPLAGALDQPGTAVLFGDHGLRYDSLSGLRFEAGWWCDPDQHLGLEAGGFALERSLARFYGGDANGQPFLARPYVNAVTGANSAYFVSQNFPDPALSAETSGHIRISSSSALSGWEINAVSNIYLSCNLRVQLIGGFRALMLDESLQANELLLPLVSDAGVRFVGTTVEIPNGVGVFDSFVAHNWFYGPQVGGRVDWQRGKLGVSLLTKVALGVSQELVTVSGASTLLTPDVTSVTVPGGILAQTSNIGRYVQNAFAVVPEANLKLSYQLTPGIQAHIGYTFLYWSDVARPGGQIDPNINPGLVPTDPRFGTPGPNRPAFTFHHDDFWAQGLDFGLEFRF